MLPTRALQSHSSSSRFGIASGARALACALALVAGCEPTAEVTRDGAAGEAAVDAQREDDGSLREPDLDASAPEDAQMPITDAAETAMDAGLADAEADAEADAAPSTMDTSVHDGAADASVEDGAANPTDTGADVLPLVDTAVSDASALSVRYERVTLSIPAGALPQGASPSVRSWGTTAPASLRPQSPVYEFEPPLALLAPATLAFETQNSNAFVYAWSSASARFEPLPTQHQSGVATAQVTELSQVFVGLCPSTHLECGGQCVETSADEAHCGGCGNPCAGDEVCWDGSCRPALGENCENAAPVPFNVSALPNARVEADILRASADVTTPLPVARLLRREGSQQPVADRVWLWTPTQDAEVELTGEVRRIGSQEIVLSAAFAVYAGGCATSQLLTTSAGAPLRFRARSGIAYYFVAFANISNRDLGQSIPSEVVQRARFTLNAGAAQPCVAGESECGGACVDLTSDVLHCGACGRSCSGYAECVAGACRCLDHQGLVQSLCGTACVDFQTDPLNCGGCGRHCAGESLCLNGRCTAESAGLSCATAIELGPELEWPLRFSMLAPLAREGDGYACGIANANPAVRYFKHTANEHQNFLVNVKPQPNYPDMSLRGELGLSVITAADCADPNRPRSCSYPNGQGNGTIALELNEGDVRYYAVSAAFGPASGRVELTDTSPHAPPDGGVPGVPDGTVCGGVWGPAQRASALRMGWVAPDPVTSPARTFTRLVDGSNHALEIERVGEWTLERMVARQYSPETGWSQPVDLGPAGLIPNQSPRITPEPQLRLVGDPLGTAFAVWRYSGELRNVIHAARYRHGIGWDSQLKIFDEEAGDRGRDTPLNVRADAALGELVVSYQPSGLSPWMHWVRRFSSQSGWLPAQTLSEFTQLRVGFDPLGLPLLVASRDKGAAGFETLISWWSTSTGMFDAPVLQPALAGLQLGKAVRVDASGNILLASGSTNRGPLTARYAGGSWSQVTTLRDVPEPAGQVQLVAIDEQHTMLLWSYNNVFAACHTAGSGWSPFRVVSEFGTSELSMVRAGPRTLVARWKTTEELAARYDW